MIDNLKIVIAVGILLGIVSFLLGNLNWFLNLEVGYITSALVIYGSFLGYKKMVFSRVDAGDMGDDRFERDYLDKLQDPYDLDDEKDSDAFEKDFKKAVKEEKEALKKEKRPLLQVIKDSRASLSVYRLISYALLFLSFMVLNTKELLHVQSYVFGIVIAPIVVIAASYYFKNASEVN